MDIHHGDPVSDRARERAFGWAVILALGGTMKDSNGGPPAPVSDVMTLREAAAYLKCHPGTLYQLIKPFEFPFLKVGSDYRFRRSAWDEWIRQATARRAAASGRRTRSRVAKTTAVRSDSLLERRGFEPPVPAA
jgi:excisionase family DNA binding protein